MRVLDLTSSFTGGGMTLRRSICSKVSEHAGCGLTHLRLPLSNETSVSGHLGIVEQKFERALVAYDPNHELDQPPGAGDVYLMHLPK
jgi:hypothetical protein